MISVIIPTFRDWERLRMCVDALHRQTLPASEYEIIVVNNDPLDPAPLSFGSVTIVTEPGQGSYAARNAGLREAVGEFIAFTDSDCLPEPDWLVRLLECHTQDKAARVGGRIELFFGGDKLTPSECYEKAFAFNQEANIKRGFSVTANMSVTRSAIDQTGLFNATLMSGGDAEWNRRATREGLSLKYCHSAIVRHPARCTLGALCRKTKRVLRDSGAVNRRRKWPIAIKGLAPPIKGLGRLLSVRSRMTVSEMVCAYLVLYFLKLYTFYLLVFRK